MLKTPIVKPVERAIKMKEHDLNISFIEVTNEDLTILAEGDGGFEGDSRKKIKPKAPVMLQ